MGRAKKAAIFIRCSDEDAERIRHAAKLERRTLSGYILNAVMNRIGHPEKMLREPENRPKSSNRRSRTAAAS
jgi:uncharacterized protein (DUF1778 family)